MLRSKMVFKVRQDEDGRHFISVEGKGFRLHLRDPADAERARAVAEFLGQNVTAIEWALRD